MIYLSFICCCSWCHSNLQVNKNPTTCLPSHTFIYSKYDIVKRFPYTFLTLNNSLSNLIIPSQRLVTMSVSSRTQTVSHCLIIQVLNIKSLLPKCLIQSPFTSVINNLEHGLAILTESFSPLRSVLYNLSCWSPKQKCVLSYAIPFYTMYTQTRLNWFPLAWTSHRQPELWV